MTTFLWRDNAPDNLVLLAIGRCAAATLNASRWIEIGLLTSARERIESHPRLLRALRFGDDDYQSSVFEILPWALGAEPGRPSVGPVTQRFPNLRLISDYLDAPSWLATNEPRLHGQLFTTAESSAATLPDGTVLDAAEAAASRLQVGEMRRQVDRIRRDYSDDVLSSIGQAKELIESTCKTILGLTGSGPETQIDLSALVKRTLNHLGLDPAEVGSDGDPAEARALKRLFGGLSGIVQGAAELGNSRGTGHGRSGAPVLEPALGRLTVGVVLSAVVYLCEVYQRSTDESPAVTPSVLRDTGGAASIPAAETGSTDHAPRMKPGDVVKHGTYGYGRVLHVESAGRDAVAKIDFAANGVKRLLVAYARLEIASADEWARVWKEQLATIPPRVVKPTATRILSSRPSGPLRPGQLVSHDVYGQGTVILVEGHEPNQVVRVDFGAAEGTKRLLVRYSPLKILSTPE